MVVITTSRGTEAVQLTSHIISSVLKSSRSISILSTTASGVPNRLTSAVASGLAEPASVVLPMFTLPEKAIVALAVVALFLAALGTFAA